jgi:hypothetical protein
LDVFGKRQLATENLHATKKLFQREDERRSVHAGHKGVRRDVENKVVRRVILAGFIGYDHNDAVLDVSRLLLGEQRPDADHVDAGQVLARILGDPRRASRMVGSVSSVGVLVAVILFYLFARCGRPRQQTKSDICRKSRPQARRRPQAPSRVQQIDDLAFGVDVRYREKALRELATCGCVVHDPAGVALSQVSHQQWSGAVV